MLTSSDLPIGAIAYGKSGTACVVTQVEGDRVTVLCSDGKLKRVPVNAIARWQSPSPPPQSVRPNRPGSVWLYDPMPEVGDRCVIRNLTESLKRQPRLSLDLQCAVYRVVRLNDDGTASLTSDYGDARYPSEWLGVLP
jgi:hypothetical protein